MKSGHYVMGFWILFKSSILGNFFQKGKLKWRVHCLILLNGVEFFQTGWSRVPLDLHWHLGEGLLITVGASFPHSACPASSLWERPRGLATAPLWPPLTSRGGLASLLLSGARSPNSPVSLLWNHPSKGQGISLLLILLGRCGNLCGSHWHFWEGGKPQLLPGFL